MLHIHPNARTTPATRAEIARSTEPSGTVAQRYDVSAETVRNKMGDGEGALPAVVIRQPSRAYRAPYRRS